MSQNVTKSGDRPTGRTAVFLDRFPRFFPKALQEAQIMEEQFYITQIYKEKELDEIKRALSPRTSTLLLRDSWRDELIDSAYAFIFRSRHIPYPGKTKIIDDLTSTIDKMDSINQFCEDYITFKKTWASGVRESSQFRY